jgi:hypothetical protein
MTFQPIEIYGCLVLINEEAQASSASLMEGRARMPLHKEAAMAEDSGRVRGEAQGADGNVNDMHKYEQHRGAYGDDDKRGSYRQSGHTGAYSSDYGANRGNYGQGNYNRSEYQQNYDENYGRNTGKDTPRRSGKP